MKLSQLIEKNPPRIGETANCFLCRIVPPGKECSSCPLLSDIVCDLFDERTYGSRSPTCVENILHHDPDR